MKNVRIQKLMKTLRLDYIINWDISASNGVFQHKQLPLIEYCFKIIINDKTCNGHISITAESLEKAYDKAYSIVSNNLSAALPDVDIPYYLKVMEEEGIQDIVFFPLIKTIIEVLLQCMNILQLHKNMNN